MQRISGYDYRLRQTNNRPSGMDKNHDQSVEREEVCQLSFWGTTAISCIQHIQNSGKASQVSIGISLIWLAKYKLVSFA